MIALRIVLLILHVVSAVLWLGPTLGAKNNVQRALASGREALALAVTDFKYRSLLATIGGLGVFVTGLALIFVAGGFAVLPPQFHAALTFSLLAIVNSLVFKGLTRRLEVASERYDDASKSDATAALKRIGMHSHISHTLWLAALVMMFIPR